MGHDKGNVQIILSKQNTKVNMRFLFAVLLSVMILSFSDVVADDLHECDGCGGKCGTHLSLTPEGREHLQRIILWENEVPLVGHKSVISPNNIFKVHFDTTGFHAPSLKDLNQNGIPDYVDSVCYYFEHVYDIYIDEFGFRSPFPDSGGRGSDHYDVYLYDLGNSDPTENQDSSDYTIGGIYGITSNATYDYISMEPFPRNYSYIMVDNDFAVTDSIRRKGMRAQPAFRYPGIPSLKVTIAHEFFHAIQFMYGRSEPASATVMEMNAVAMERVFFPEVLDYLQYVRAVFRNPSSYPFGTDDSFIGYGHSIFNQYLIEKFGIDIMRIMWEKVALGNEVYSAIDLALKEFGSSMPLAWCEFVEWAYYTGSRASDKSFFTNAQELPLIEPFSVINFSPPSGSASGNLTPLEFRMLRFFFPGEGDITDDTLDVMLANIDLQSASRQVNISRDYFWQVADNQIADSKKIEGINYWEYSEIDNMFICPQTFVRPGGNTYEISHAYPNPFRRSLGHKNLNFPAPANTEIYKKVLLVVYDSEMRQVFTKLLPITVNNKNKVVVWSDVPENISSGTYIFGVHNGDDVTIGKFAIIND